MIVREPEEQNTPKTNPLLKQLEAEVNQLLQPKDTSNQVRHRLLLKQSRRAKNKQARASRKRNRE